MLARQICYGSQGLTAKASTLTVSWLENTLDKALLLIGVACYGGTDVAIGVPTGSGLWTRIGSQTDRLTNQSVTWFKRENSASVAAGTVETIDLTATLDGSALPEYAEVFALEYSPTWTVSVNKTASGSSQTIDTGAVSSLTDSEIAVGLAANANAPLSCDQGANTTGFTQLHELHSSTSGTDRSTAAVYEKQLGSAGASAQLTVPLTGGISRAWCAQVVTVKAALNPPPGTDDGKIHQWPSLQESNAIASDADANALIALPGLERATGPAGLYGTSDKFGGRANILFNNGIKSWVYVKGTAFQLPSTGNTNPLNFPEDWFAHTVKKGDPNYGPTTRINISASVMQMQPGTTGTWTDTTKHFGGDGTEQITGFNAYRAREATWTIQQFEAQYGAGFQAGGVWMDSLGNDQIHGQVDPSTGTAYTYTTWKPLANALIQAAVAAVAALGTEYEVWCNGLASNPDEATVAKGGMIENYVLNDATPPVIASATITDGTTVADMNDTITAQIAGGGQQGLCSNDTADPPMTEAEHVKWLRFLVATYYLSNRGSNYFSYDAGPLLVAYQSMQTDPILTQDLGLPLESQSDVTLYRKSTLQGGGYVYGREYNNGYVLLNTSWTNDIQVTLPRNDYTDVDGVNIPQTYTVPKHSGMLLIAPSSSTGGGQTPTTIDAEWSGLTIPVPTAGSRVQGPTFACSHVVIIADPANTGTVVYGGNEVSGVAPVKGFQLSPGRVSPRLSITNLNKLYFDAANNGDKLFLSIII